MEKIIKKNVLGEAVENVISPKCDLRISATDICGITIFLKLWFILFWKIYYQWACYRDILA